MSFNTIYEQVPLGSLAKFINGDRGENYPKPTDYVASGIPFVSATDIEGGYIAWKQSKKISPASFASLRGGRVQRGDILFCLRGSLGKLGYVEEEIEGAIASSLVILRAESLSLSRYLRFVLCGPQVQEAIKSLDNGSVQGNISAAALKNLLIPLPPMAARVAITSALEAVEGLIDLNRRINRTLEAMAQATFKSWFVDFDPVKAKIAAKAEGSHPMRAAMSAVSGKTDSELDALSPEQHAHLAATAALFPDEMEESELGEIPKGWHASSLGEQCAYLNRGISPKYIVEGGVLVLNQKCIRDFSLDPSKGRRHDPNQRNVSGRELQLGDVLVNSTGVGTLGRVAQVLWLDEPTIVDSHVTVARAGSKLNSAYLGQWFVTKQPEIEAMGEGSTGQTELSRVKLASMPITLPPSVVLGAFAAVLSPLQSLIANRYRASLMLQETRDALLPRLLSGELQPTVASEGVEG